MDNNKKWIVILLGGVFGLLLDLLLIFIGTIPSGPLGLNAFTVGWLILDLVLIVSALLIKTGKIENKIYINLIFAISIIFCFLGVLSLLSLLKMSVWFLTYIF